MDDKEKEKQKRIKEVAKHRELKKKLYERIKQLRMTEYIDDDEEPEIFLDVS
tara:strand:+ start:985 stop:1140 length:156 start_codon:yes stop_codon:yes gene_type:complete